MPATSVAAENPEDAVPSTLPEASALTTSSISSTRAKPVLAVTESCRAASNG
jgi:hypothetical protein